jgi:hypothetical protein
VTFISVVLKHAHIELLRTLSIVFGVEYVMAMLNYGSCVASDHIRGSQRKWCCPPSRDYLDVPGVLEEGHEAQIKCFLANKQVSIIW